MQDKMKILLISPPHIEDNTHNSWLGDCFGYERAREVSFELADWYRQLADMYGCTFMDASQYITASLTDSIHIDAGNHRKLAEAIAEIIDREKLLNP